MSESQHPTASHHLLEGCNALGIDYLFCNLGTDHAPIIEEMARWQRENRRMPKVILCPHENTAVHMAAGYAVATGRGQAVLVHVDAGTANAAMGLHNLFRARIPVLLMAGKAPFSTYGELHGGRQSFVHFVQEPYDQGSVVRPYVKWEYTLPAAELTREVLARGYTMMQSDPPGPAYLMLPREVLAARAPEVPPIRRRSVEARPLRAGPAVAADVERIADGLLAAIEPLLITGYAGRNPAVPPLLDELAQLAGVRVCEFNPLYVNMPRSSPCFGGSQPGPFAERTDFGIVLDSDVPWVPSAFQGNPDAYWVQVDVDALKRDMPMWSFPTDLRMEADAETVLRQLIEAVRARQTPEQANAAAVRVEIMAQERAKRRAAAEALAAQPGEDGAIAVPFLCAALARALHPDDIVVNETITNASVVDEHLPRERPGTKVCTLAGGLGFSGGVALGQKLAHPERTVVQIVGDGSFYFCNPSSVYAVAGQYGLPIFTVVLDNSGWGAVKASTLRMYPKGEAHDTDQFASLLAPDMDFGKVAEGAGAHGEVVSDPAAVNVAIARCLAAVRSGRSAVLHARVSPL